MSLLSFSSAIDCFLLLPVSLVRISYGVDIMLVLLALSLRGYDGRSEVVRLFAAESGDGERVIWMRGLDSRRRDDAMMAVFYYSSIPRITFGR